MNILVTGGAGFIGSHLIDNLLKSNNVVFCIDNFDTFYDPLIKRKNIKECLTNDNFKLIEGDIRDKSLLKKLFAENKFELVIHLAAKAGVRPSIINPKEYYDVNVNGTLSLLEAMRKNNVKKMIFASSSSVYGNNKKIPFSEDDNVDNPISPYAATKKAGELLCHTYHHLYGFDIFCLRFFTVYGPRQRPDLAIHKFARLILDNKPIPFYGNGNTKRDYTYIDDIIEGIIASVEQLKGYEIINLGNSKTISLSKVVAVLENALGKKAILEKLPLQPGDVEKTYADISKAKKLLSYNPKYSFEKGVENFTKWLLNNK